MDSRNTTGNDYLKTAHKVFEGCGMDGKGGLSVDKLMDKIAAYVPPDKSEDLLSLLDPSQSNPTITAHELAAALEKYGEAHLTKDIDDSVNMRNGSTPFDSDSGISSDVGYPLVEELQMELRDRRQTERKLRFTLEAAERAHEDAIAALSAERDSLRAHIHMMREENSALAHLRSEYEESSEKMAATETALETTRRELEALNRRLKASAETIDNLQTENATLQALLAKSKEECHRMNDMYAARQATLIEENETYKTNFADLDSRFQEQEEFLQQTLKEKVLLEMEMADLLNHSNRETTRPNDRSFEVSCTDQQLLQALDSLNLDSVCREDTSVSVATQADQSCAECETRNSQLPAARTTRIKKIFMEHVSRYPTACSRAVAAGRAPLAVPRVPLQLLEPRLCPEQRRRALEVAQRVRPARLAVPCRVRRGSAHVIVFFLFFVSICAVSGFRWE